MAKLVHTLSAANATVLLGRQRGEGYFNRRTQNMLPMLFTQVDPQLGGSVENTGIEIGSNSNMEQRDIKSSTNLSVTLNGHVRTGAIWNFLCGLGYKPNISGTAAVSGAYTGSLARAHVKGSRALELGDLTGISIGDKLQIGVSSTSPEPLRTDKCSVHEVAALLATGQSAQWHVIVPGAPTTGSWYLYYDNVPTVALAAAAVAADVQTALENLSNIGTGNVTVTGAGTEASPFVVALAGTKANLAAKKLTANGDSLTGGTGWGPETGLGTDFYVPHVEVVNTQDGSGVNSVLIKTSLIYDFDSGAPVVKIDATQPTRVVFWHVQSDDPIDLDLHSLLIKTGKSVDDYASLYFDGKCTRFNLQFNKGSVFTFSAEMKFADVVKVATDDTSITATTPAGATLLTSTRGTFDYLGNKKIAPTGFSVTIESDIPDDFALFRYKQQSMTHVAHRLTMTADGKFVKAISDKINFNDTAQTVSDVIPEYPMDLKFQSMDHIGSTVTPYSVRLKANDVQFSQYNPSLQGGQYITANIGTIKVVPSTTQAENWYLEMMGTSTTDDFAAL